MSDYFVRQASISDLDTIVLFNRELAWESEGRKLDETVLRVGVAALLADPDKGVYFVAEHNGQVVGQLLITYEWSDWRKGWFWWLQSVYVHPDHRQRGVLRRLVDHVLELARTGNRQVIGLRLYVESGNRVAQEVYRRLGFQPTEYKVLEWIPEQLATCKSPATL
jgi:GNAT superfamily N-acetyltransferase